MLPSKRYFVTFPCPFFEENKCERPHCHYRHVAAPKGNQLQPTGALQEIVSEAVQESQCETTQKSDANDLVSKLATKIQSSGVQNSQPPPGQPLYSSQPAYKPTPISELNKQRHIPVAYAPSRPTGTFLLKKPTTRSNIIPYDPNHPSSSTSYPTPSPAYSRNCGEQSNDSGDELEVLKTLDTQEKFKLLDSILEKEFSENVKLESTSTNDKNINGHEPTPEELLASLEGDDDSSDISSKPVQSKKRSSSVEIEPSPRKRQRADVDGKSNEDKNGLPEIVKKEDATSKDKHNSSSKKCESSKDKSTSKSTSKKSHEHRSEHKSSSSHSHKRSSEKSRDSSKDKHSDRSSKKHSSIKSSKDKHSSDKSKDKHSDHKSRSKSSESSKSRDKSKSKHSKDKSTDSKHKKSDHKVKESAHSSERHSSKKSTKKDSDRNESSISSDQKHSSSRTRKPSSKDRKHSKSSSSKKSRSKEKIKSSDVSDGEESSGSVELEDVQEDAILITDSDQDSPSQESDDADHMNSDDELSLNVSDQGNEGNDSGSGLEDGYVEDVRKKIRIAHQNAGNAVMYKPTLKPARLTPQQMLSERWAKAKATVQASSSQKVRIASVPNVHSLLSERSSILSTVSTSNSATNKRPSSEVEEYVPPSKNRVAHQPAFIPSNSHRPVLKMDGETKVPAVIRQTRLTMLYEEFAKFLPPREASEKALEHEKEIHSRIKCTKTYQSAITVAVLRIRKNKGVEASPTVHILTSESIPEWTYGLSLYDCFAKYLLTEDELRENGYPLELYGHEGCAYVDPSSFKPRIVTVVDEYVRRCVNCARTYSVDEDGIPLAENDCTYHWGKAFRVKVAGALTQRYQCCSAELGSEPCTTARYHVCNTFDERCLDGYVKTLPNSRLSSPKAAGVYGVDCEMCHTTLGLEITRCSVVDLNGKVVYDSKIKPDAKILDYCTRFSGITEKDLENVTKRLPQVQLELMKFISDKTILVGHSLENDLRALKLIHNCVVDTSIVFPHKNAPVIKRALKNLAREMLSTIIQDQDTGHCSAEDARTCIDIMIHKIKADACSRKPRQIVSVNSKKVS